MSPQDLSESGIILPGPLNLTGSVVGVSAELHMSSPPRVFVFDATNLYVDATTVLQHIRGKYFHNTTLSYELSRRESPVSKDSRVRYILRFAKDDVQPWVQRLYFPFDASSGGGRVWGVFNPLYERMTCMFCLRECQSSSNNICPFVHRIGP